MCRVLQPAGTAAATVWDNYGGMPSWRMFWDTISVLEPEATDKNPTRKKRPMTGQGELRSAFERAGFLDVTDVALTIRMDYSNFDDFWYPMVYELPQTAKTALGKQKRDRQFDRTFRYIDDLKASHVFPIAGPPCFPDDELWQFNDLGQDGPCGVGQG